MKPAGESVYIRWLALSDVWGLGFCFQGPDSHMLDAVLTEDKVDIHPKNSGQQSRTRRLA